MRRIYAPLLLLLIIAAVVWGQSKNSVFITSGSQSGGEAGATAHWLGNFIAIEIEKQYPCANVTADTDVADLLKFQHDRSLLDPNYTADLSSLAASLGAKYLISVTATQTGGQIYMQATCMDANSAKTLERDGKQTSSQDASDGAQSFARDFAKELGPQFAVKPESGKTYPVGTVFPGVFKRTFSDHAHIESTWTEVLDWSPGFGFMPPYHGEGDDHLHCGPENWGDCGGCKDCTCAGNCYVQLNSPGRYRLVNATDSILKPDLKVEFVAEVTIAGSCKK